jgi:hypothetical protein
VAACDQEIFGSVFTLIPVADHEETLAELTREKTIVLRRLSAPFRDLP